MKNITIGQQVFRMKTKFPSFKFYKKERCWVGTLRPTIYSPEYKVKIVARKHPPKVFVLEPKIVANAPHVYPDGSLCLYYYRDYSFSKMDYIADKIIPWTAEWLYFYEKWLEDGIWWGAEAPHSFGKGEGHI